MQYKTKIGDPLDPRTTLGPIAIKSNMETVKEKVRIAVERDGARIIYGSLDYKMEDEPFLDGNWMEPIITEGISTDSPSFQ